MRERLEPPGEVPSSPPPPSGSGNGRRTRVSRIIRYGLYLSIICVFFAALLELSLRLLPEVVLWTRRVDHATLATARFGIACMGDSVTYGARLPKEHSYPEQLKSMLEQEGLAGAQVLNLAMPGAITKTMVERELPALDKVPSSTSMVVLLQGGHNDFMSWRNLPPLPNNVQPGLGQAPRLNEPESAQRMRPKLRLVRVLSWMWRTLSESDLPVLVGGEEVEREFVQNVSTIQQRVTSAGGTMFLLTYVVPGRAPIKLDPHSRLVLKHTRDIQLHTNRIIRRTATSLKIPLIDLEYLIEVPDLWTHEAFVDNIHLSARWSTRVARTIRQELALRNVVPYASSSSRP